MREWLAVKRRRALQFKREGAKLVLHVARISIEPYWAESLSSIIKP
jgi:hypothetical protein